MPFNGSGVWSYNLNWVNDAANGIPITASRMDAQFDDAGNNGFDNCLTRDGQGSATANTPWNGFKITGLGAPTTSGDALSYGHTLGPATATQLTISSGAVANQLILNGNSGSLIWLQRAASTVATINATASDLIFTSPGLFDFVGNSGAVSQLQIDGTASTVATGIKITGAAAAAGAAISVLSSGTDEALAIDAKGSGTITLGATSTGSIVVSRALTYGGVTLTNSVSGTGSMVLGNVNQTSGACTITCGTSGTITVNGTHSTITWTRIGNFVYFGGLVQIASVSSPLGSLTLTLTGLPSSVNSFSGFPAVSVWINGAAATMTTTPSAQMQGNSNTMLITKTSAGAQVDLAGDMQASAAISISGMYPIN